MRMQIQNLGRAMTALVKAEVIESVMHEDVEAFGAPSECHSVVQRGIGGRMRKARRYAEGITGSKLKEIDRQAMARGYNKRAGDRLFDILYNRLSPYGRN